jgi:hypothetical protein
MKIQCQTLFDITATGTTGHVKPSRMPYVDNAGTKITNTESWNRSRNQQRNWETVTQLISLRTQVDNLQEPRWISDRWCFEFEVENENLFNNGADRLAVLKTDCQGVPMLTGLNESINIGTVLAVDKNIWFTIVPINIL